MPIYQTGGYQVKSSAVNKVKQAIKEFVAAHPGLLTAELEREEKFGCTFAPNGHFIRV